MPSLVQGRASTEMPNEGAIESSWELTIAQSVLLLIKATFGVWMSRA
jgi:hypothetical protein